MRDCRGTSVARRLDMPRKQRFKPTRKPKPAEQDQHESTPPAPRDETDPARPPPAAASGPALVVAVLELIALVILRIARVTRFDLLLERRIALGATGGAPALPETVRLDRSLSCHTRICCIVRTRHARASYAQ